MDLLARLVEGKGQRGEGWPNEEHQGPFQGDCLNKIGMAPKQTSQDHVHPPSPGDMTVSSLSAACFVALKGRHKEKKKALFLGFNSSKKNMLRHTHIEVTQAVSPPPRPRASAPTLDVDAYTL